MDFSCGLSFEGQFLCGDIIVNMTDIARHDFFFVWFELP